MNRTTRIGRRSRRPMRDLDYRWILNLKWDLRDLGLDEREDFLLGIGKYGENDGLSSIVMMFDMFL